MSRASRGAPRTLTDSLNVTTAVICVPRKKVSPPPVGGSKAIPVTVGVSAARIWSETARVAVSPSVSAAVNV